MTGSEGVVDRRLESSPRVSAGAHRRRKHWKAINGDTSITTGQSRASKIRKATRGTHYDTQLPSRAVTNRLSEVSITHDDTSRLTVVQVV